MDKWIQNGGARRRNEKRKGGGKAKIGEFSSFFSPSSSFPYFSLSFFFSNRELLKYESRKKSRSSDVEKEGKICIPCVSGGKTFFTGQVGSVVDSLKR